jgi:diaminopropionate ammonia-lyase
MPKAAPAVAKFTYFPNPHRIEDFRVEPVSTAARDYHARLPGPQPTRLARLDELAAELGVARVWLKDESYRFGLPAFKVLGVSWAMYKAFSELLGHEPREWSSVEDLREAFAPLGPLTVTTATDGNHGRAVARVARWLGASARILVSTQVPEARAAAIRAEGAEVVVIDGTYDDAVEAALAGAADDGALLISDTASSEDQVVPRWIVEGYSTMMHEVEDQLAGLREPAPDVVLVQMGVGSLAGAVAMHYRREGATHVPSLVGVEPASAACVLESARAGEFKTVPGPHTSAMDCLAAGAPSVTTLPTLLATFDAFIAVDDALVASSVLRLAKAGVVAGPTGVAGVVGLRAARDQLGLTEDTSVLLINSEGAADPDGYAAALRTAQAS